MPEIIFKNVTVKYQLKKTEVTALENFNAKFLNNKTNVIIGYSGSGKTTLLKVLAEITEYYGDITFNGVDMEQIPLEERGIAYISQEYSLYPHMNVFDNIAFPLKIMRTPVEEISRRVREISKKLGIEHCLMQKPKHLSGGQQQRVAIARALVKNPTLCLFDEPLSNVDAQTGSTLRVLFKQLFSELNNTVIYITHDIEEATSLGDTIFVMNEGKIVCEGSPSEILKSNNKVVQSLFGAK